MVLAAQFEILCSKTLIPIGKKKSNNSMSGALQCHHHEVSSCHALLLLQIPHLNHNELGHISAIFSAHTKAEVIDKSNTS